MALVSAYGVLVAVGHETLLDYELCAGFEFADRVALRGVHALYLDHLHLAVAALVHVDLGLGIQDALPGAVAGTVVLFHITDARVLSDMEAVHAVMLGILLAAVVYTAAGDDQNVAVLAHIKIVVDSFRHPAFADDHGNVHAFLFSARLDDYVYAADVSLGDDIDVCGGVAAFLLAVNAEIVSAGGDAVQVRDFFEYLFLDICKHLADLLNGFAAARDRGIRAYQ